MKDDQEDDSTGSEDMQEDDDEIEPRITGDDYSAYLNDMDDEEEERVREIRPYRKDLRRDYFHEFYRDLMKNWRRMPDLMDDDPFAVDDDFTLMKLHLDDLIRRVVKGELGEDDSDNPVIYGFSMRKGPDGKPRIQEFGNRNRSSADFHMPGKANRVTGNAPGEHRNFREPLTDIIEDERHISVTLEMPGVSKEDVDIEMNESEVTVNVNTSTRRYHKHVRLPTKVRPASVRATFNNGVLDLIMEKQVLTPGGKHRVSIE